MDKSRYALQQLEKKWFEDLYRFEVENRQWFEQFVDPRPKGYFDYPVFESFQNQLVVEQEKNLGLYFLALEDQVRVIGRFNFYDIQNDVIELGYRIAEDRSGMGITSHLVAEMIKIVRFISNKPTQAGSVLSDGQPWPSKERIMSEGSEVMDLTQLRAIRARVKMGNPGSIKVLENNGFVRVQEQDNLLYFEKRLS